MRVAILVHNNVMQDPRIQKQVRSLEKKNIDCTIFGLTKEDVVVKSGLKAKIVLSKTNVKVLFKNLIFFAASALTFLFMIMFWFAYTNGYSNEFLKLVSVIFSLLITFVFLFSFCRLKDYLMNKSKDNHQEINQKKSALGSFKTSVKCAADYVISYFAYMYLSNQIYQEAIKHGKFDAIHCHDIIALGAAIKLKNKWNIPLIWDAHEFYTMLGYVKPGRKKLHHDCIKNASKHIDYFITISDYFGEYYCKTYSLPKAHVIMNASEKLEDITYDGRLHEAVGLPLSKKILIYQGVYGPKRGLTELIDSMQFIEKDYHLVMMGWGIEEEKLKSHAANINESISKDGKGITFIPPQPHKELPLWTVGAHFGIIPYENSSINHLYCTPNKLWEYPNVEVPIISSSMVELEKVLKEHEIGFLFQREFTAKDIANCINNVSDSKYLQAKKNCEQFKQTHNWSKYEPELYKIYDDLETR